MEGTSGQESPGIMGRAAGGAVQGRRREQLDSALENSWRGEPSNGHGHGFVRTMGTRGCPSWRWTKLGPCGARGGSVPSQPPPEQPQMVFLFPDGLDEVTRRLPEQGEGSRVAGARSLKQKEKYIRNVQLLSLA